MIKKFYKLSKEKLFPVCRSLTGDGNRQTLNLIKKQFPKLKIISFNSGSNVFDWKIPSEWKVKKAYVQDKMKILLILKIIIYILLATLFLLKNY